MQLEGNTAEQAAEFEIFVWYLKKQGLVYFAPMTANLAGAITHQARKYPDHFGSDAAFVEEHRDLLTRAFSHIIREEWAFGFEAPTIFPPSTEGYRR